MLLEKCGLGINVMEAAQGRIRALFDRFDKISVSFSGGKESTALLHLVMAEAIRRSRTVTVLFIDWEAQYKLTIEHVRRCLWLYREHAEVQWVALPLKTTNACSQFEPEWICWDSEKRDLWVRELPVEAISDGSHFPFYSHGMTFEEFVPEWGKWFAGNSLSAITVGIRCDESLNRWRALFGHASRFEDWRWTTWKGIGAYNAYPIYDWKVSDIWTYFGQSGLPYNPIYDRMHQAGLTLSQMRICEPYGDEQRRGLWLYHVLEPETWPRVVARVAGANSGALYGAESGNVLGNRVISLPSGHTWQSFAGHLLSTMPPSTADHYKDKIAVWIAWYRHRGREIEDFVDDDTGSKDAPSWRRVCKMLLKNDYWCKTICFSPTKQTAYLKYKRMMEKRRRRWGIYG